jgi:hypothetical protein
MKTGTAGQQGTADYRVSHVYIEIESLYSPVPCCPGAHRLPPFAGKMTGTADETTGQQRRQESA